MTGPPPGRQGLIGWGGALGLAGWALLAWMAFDMGHPVAQLAMPGSSDWTVANLTAIVVMWTVMMAAMMLPSALPMFRTFALLQAQRGEKVRARAFIGAYLLMWTGFGIAATCTQWVLQAAGWLNSMIVSTSAVLSAVLLLIAGAYQFSALKHACLSRCRTPLGFLIGEWRPGTAGAFAMGLRHGLFCVGCCWALMALLFVGGAMNLLWIAAVAFAVAIEKLVPGGERVSKWLGAALIAAGVLRLVVLVR